MKPIIVKKCNINGYILYPDENGNGVVLSEQCQLGLFKFSSKLYPNLIDIVGKNIKGKFECSPAVIDAITHHTIINLLHVFFDTTIRIGIAVNTSQDTLCVIKTGNLEYPSSIENFSINAQLDENFHQSLIYFISSIWNIKETHQNSFYYKSEEFNRPSFINHMSRLYPRNIFRASLQRIKAITFYLAGKLFNPNMYTLSLSYLSNPFLSKGMFVRNFKKINVDFNIADSNRDESIRREIFNKELLDNLDLEWIFNKINLTSNEKDNYKRKLVEYLSFFYPLRSLEMLPKIVDLLNPQIEQYTKGIFLTGTSVNTNSCYLSALLKDRGFKLVRLQHGGYVGYYKFGYRKNYMWTTEFTLCDYFLTWGWSNQHNKLDKENLKFIPFVSPWISERKKYWGYYKTYKNKNYEFDVLIMPTKLSKITPMGWICAIDEISFRPKSLINIVKQLEKNSITMLYKSPGLVSESSYLKSIDKMIEVGKEKFTILENIDKGLNINLVKRVSVILWDAVGMGFLECIACGLPTMVFLEDDSSIDDDMKNILHEAKMIGIIHADITSLTNEILIYKQCPEDWMNNLDRVSIIHKLTSLYCNTNNNWNNNLMKILSKIKV
jgi:hypothetical protein